MRLFYRYVTTGGGLVDGYEGLVNIGEQLARNVVGGVEDFLLGAGDGGRHGEQSGQTKDKGTFHGGVELPSNRRRIPLPVIRWAGLKSLKVRKNPVKWSSAGEQTDERTD
jgi:hypothetical protein